MHPPSLRVLPSVPVLNYVNAELAFIYRALVHAFFAAKQSYTVELTPQEVVALVRRERLAVDVEFEARIDERLSSLARWGNLAQRHDSAAVGRLEDFYRRRYVYRLTAQGEVAHDAVLRVERTVGQSGSLQASMLGTITVRLQDLVEASAETAPRPDRVMGLFHDLFAAFATLAQEASAFMGDLLRQNENTAPQPEHFMLRKRALINYLTRFIGELRDRKDGIATAILTLRGTPMGRLLDIASQSPDLPPADGASDPAAHWRERQQRSWEGVIIWFVGAAQGSATVHRLTQLAVDVVLDLTRMLSRLDATHGRVLDRRADFNKLAQMFSACLDDGAAHGLWYAAFGLHSARHFHLEEEDAELTSTRASWWDAPPVEVSLPVRQNTPRSGAGGAAGAVPDHAGSKRRIAAQQQAARQAAAEAQSIFVGCGEFALASLAKVSAAQLAALLNLLDQALAEPPDPQGVRWATNTEGTLEIKLYPPLGRASIHTELGRLHCPNYRLHVRPLARRGERYQREARHGA